MLKEITIKNFKSFNEEVTFSMEADVERVSEFPEHVEILNDNHLLKIASLYGPNGGGKSNLIKALVISKYLQNIENYYLGPDLTCVFNNSNDIEQTLFFVVDKYEIGYHFIVNCALENEAFPLEIQPERRISPRTQLDIIQEDIVYRKINTNTFISLCSRNKDGSILGENFLKIVVRYTI